MPEGRGRKRASGREPPMSESSKPPMQWPPDVTKHIWDWTRILLRPGLKKRTWANIHTEMRAKWVEVFFGPICSGVACSYNERGRIEEGGFEYGHECSTYDTVIAAVAVVGIPNAWDINGLFLDCGVGEPDDKEWRKEALELPLVEKHDFPYFPYFVENAEWMVECMNNHGLEASLSDLQIESRY